MLAKLSELVQNGRHHFSRQENSITFAISDKPVEKVANDVYTSNETKEFKEYVARSDKNTPHRVHNPNGFVNAIVSCYNSHHDLILRPDDVWLAIMVQFGSYVENTAETLRETFVSHQGQKELVVQGDGNLFTADYDALGLAMSTQIAANIKDPSVRDWVMPKFTTTKPVDRVVGSIVLMAAMKKYFTYKTELSCGLPHVTLEGTVEDWEELERRADRLVEFDTESGYMKKWHAMLSPVLAEFTQSAKGTPELDWWARVCNHLGGGSGPSYLSGWITVFCVFHDSGKWVGDQKRMRSNWGKGFYTSECSFAPEGWPVINGSDIPNGYCNVDVTVDDHGTVYKCEMMAGHRSFVVKNKTQIQPQVSWILHVKNPEPKTISKDKFSDKYNEKSCF